MLVPHNTNSRVINVKLPAWSFKAAGFFILFCCLALIGSLYYYTKTNQRLVNYDEVITENKLHRRQLEHYDEETKRLNVALQSLKERDQEVRGLLGLRELPLSGSSQETLKKKHLNRIYRNRFRALTVANLDKSLFTLNKDLIESKNSFSALLESVKAMKDKFVYTPSIWPIHGQIESKYGWRRQPVYGSLEFHPGVDIPTYPGAPVRATAKGRVIYAGWYSGYGNVVMIEHRKGLMTIYGHNSRLLVRVGSLVDKGQVVARAGSTGLSTGTHVHYEIRRWNHTVNPVKYLNMDIFTASKDL